MQAMPVFTKVPRKSSSGTEKRNNRSPPAHSLVQGAVFMCKQNELWGSCLMALGAGMLLSLLFGSDFLTVFLGLGLLFGGLCLCRRH